MRQGLIGDAELDVATPPTEIALDRAETARLATSAPAGDDPTEVWRSKSETRRPRWWLALVAMLAVLALVGYLQHRESDQEAPPAPGALQTSYEQLTSHPGTEQYPSVSPDGKWVVYSGEGSGNYDIYLQRVGGQTAINLTEDSPDDDKQPAYSPDGEQIASWSPDDKRLTGSAGYPGAGIVTYSFESQTYERLTDFGEWPVWLPDSRQILFVASGKELYIVDSRTKEVRKIFSVTRDVLGPPRISRDGTEIFFSRRVTEADIWLLTLS